MTKRVLHRGMALLALVTVLIGASANSASAAPPHFYDFGTIHCPLPWLKTGFGLLSHCTQATHGGPAVGRPGFFAPWADEESDFSAGPGWFDRADETSYVDMADVQATDGTVGTFRGHSKFITNCCGDVTYGVQYIYFYLQPIGRWGNYSWVTGKFHPAGDWYQADGPI